MIINRFNINTSEMPTTSTSRVFEVTGEIGAEFTIIALEVDTLKYYDFQNQIFELGHNSIDNNLIVKLSSKKYNNSILFPEGGGNYIIKLIATNGTTVNNSKSTIISRSISKQSSNTTITFKADTLTSSSSYTTFPTTTSTGTTNSSANVDFNWDITNVSTDANGFGLRLTGDYTKINDKFWYTKATTDVDGAISSSTTLVVDSLTGIGVGTQIVSGTGLSGTPSVLSIDEESKTLTLSDAQSFSDGVTLTFIARNSENIKAATGLDLTFTLYPEVTSKILTKTVRAGGSGTTINLNGTYGIAGGNHVGITGLGVDNSSANKVTSVSASSTAGSIVVQNSQSLLPGGVISFKGCSQTINFLGNIQINKYSSANTTVYLDLDKLITVGAAS